jgi:hypothetical protein
MARRKVSISQIILHCISSNTLDAPEVFRIHKLTCAIIGLLSRDDELHSCEIAAELELTLQF